MGSVTDRREILWEIVAERQQEGYARGSHEWLLGGGGGGGADYCEEGAMTYVMGQWPYSAISSSGQTTVT